MRLCWYRGVWNAYVSRGKRLSLGTPDRTLAEQRLKDLINSQKRPPETVSQVVQEYLDASKDKASYKSMLSVWKPAQGHFGSLRPDQIDRNTCLAYISKRRDAGYTDETIRHEIGIVRTAIRWKDPKTPCIFELPSAPAPRERYLTKEEVRSLINACNLPHLKLFVILAITTAGRKTAILELTWDRVDFDRKQIRLSTGNHGNKGRATVRMNNDAQKALLEAKKGALTEYVVEYGAKRVKNIQKGFKSACDIAGLKNVTPHDLRRTAAVWMAGQGISMDEIAGVLGHSSSSTTFRVYAKYSPDYQQEAAAALEIYSQDD